MSSSNPSILKETELLLLKKEQEEEILRRNSGASKSYQPPFVPQSTSSSLNDIPPSTSSKDLVSSTKPLEQSFQSINLSEKQAVIIGPEKAPIVNNVSSPIPSVSTQNSLFIKPGFMPVGRVTKFVADANNIYFHVENDVIPDPQDPTKDKKVDMFKDENFLVITDAHHSEKKYMVKLLFTSIRKNLEVKAKLSGNRDNKGNREVERVEVQINWS